MTTSPPPSSEAKKSWARRDTILYGLGGTIALSIPPTITAIEDPTKRAVVALVALVVVFGLGLFATTPRRRG
jgi:hypothetical protein